MKTGFTRLSSLKIVFSLLLSIYSVVAFGLPDYDFRNGTLISGTANQVGAIYRFNNVKRGVDAKVTIVNLTNGLTINDIDGATGYVEALQPVIEVPAGKNGYAELKIDFFLAGTNIPLIQLEVPATPIDVDGTSTRTGSVYEYDMVQLMPLSYILFNTMSRELRLQFAPGWVTGSNTGGVSYDDIDTTAKQVMFTVVNSAVTSMTIRVGADNRSAVSQERLRSVYFMKFDFPNTVLSATNLLSFEGSDAEKENKLSWSLRENTMTTRIMLERSNTGKDFHSIAEFVVNADESNQTKFSYNDPKEGASSLYRLKLISASGKIEYSNVLSFKNIETDTRALKVFPTIINTNATANIYANRSQTVTVSWTDLSGKVMQKQTANLQKGVNNFTVTKPASLPKGNYILSLAMENKIFTDRVIVN